MPESLLPLYERDSEADTCRKEVLPKLYYSQWTDDLILEQRTFTDGMIQVIGRKARRGKAKRYDYLLRYRSYGACKAIDNLLFLPTTCT